MRRRRTCCSCATSPQRSRTCLGEHLLVVAEDRSALSRLRAADLNVIPAVAIPRRADGDARPRHLARSRLNHALRLLVSGLTVAMMDADVTVTDSPFAFLEAASAAVATCTFSTATAPNGSSRLRFGASFIVARPSTGRRASSSTPSTSSSAAKPRRFTRRSTARCAGGGRRSTFACSTSCSVASAERARLAPRDGGCRPSRASRHSVPS